MQTLEIKTKAKWIVDLANGRVGFNVKHFVFMNMDGALEKYDAGISMAKDDFATMEIGFWINPECIDIRNEQKDAHFIVDIEKFKEISFSSNTLVELIRSRRYMSYGEFAMNGIRQQMLLDVETNGRVKDSWGMETILFNINGKINRTNGALIWNAVLAAGDVLISEEVWIDCKVHLIRAK